MTGEPTRVGQIVGAHGLKGQVKVAPLTDFLSRFDRGVRLRLRGEWVTIEASQIHKGRPLIKLTGVDSIDAAQKLQWEYLEAIVEDLELEDDEFLVEDLLGLRVVTVEGKDLGEVDEIIPTPAHDVLVVGEVMIPIVKEFIHDINLDDEVITVQLIPGMLPGEDVLTDRP